MAKLLEEGDPDASLPDTVDVTQKEIERYFEVFLWWISTGRRFLPSVLMKEPSEPFSAVLEIDGYYEMMKAQLQKSQTDASSNLQGDNSDSA